MQFTDLVKKADYLNEKDLALLTKAYETAAKAHLDQNRLSGEKYIQHPLNVADILADLRLDAETLATAILHDVVEDTHITSLDLQKEFGKDIAKLVAGVTKLDKISMYSAEQVQAENIRKMLVAMAEDIRVVLVKLADRLQASGRSSGSSRTSPSARSTRRPTPTSSAWSRASARSARRSSLRSARSSSASWSASASTPRSAAGPSTSTRSGRSSTPPARPLRTSTT